MNPFISLKTIIVVFVLITWAGIAGAQSFQSFPRLKALPPKKDATVLKATPALAPNSPWQLLTNQPPVLDYFDCGPGNPILLTDGTVMLARSEEHTSELQSQDQLVCRLLLEKKKTPLSRS